MVDFPVVFGDAFVWDGLDDFKIELVLFRYCSNGGRARIRLRADLVTHPRCAGAQPYIIRVQLTERHDFAKLQKFGARGDVERMLLDTEEVVEVCGFQRKINS